MNGMENLNPAQMKQLEEMKNQILGKILDRRAHERLSRVRLVNPNLAGQVDLYMLQIYQSGKIHKKISDQEMKEVLKVLSAKKDFTIKRR